MFKIIIQDDEGKTTIVPFVREELTIGRKEGNTIRLTERNVSREHAKISRNDSVVSLEDLASYNGIRVNGTKIKGKVDLKVSDRIQIGDYLLEIKPEKTDSPQSEEEALDAQETNPNMLGLNVPTKPLIKKADPETDPTPMPDIVSPLANTQRLQKSKIDDSVDPELEEVTPSADKERAARLVVLSTNYAGDEFHLKNRSMVIGRTEDNDIWLDHRSISRHHAKILREDDRYSVVDLQSSNGVRVNGEVYGKVELRKGDEIDLGHVRLRFVEHDEDFVFARDAEVVDLSKSSGGGGLKWVVLLALLAAIGVGAYTIIPSLMNKDTVAVNTTPKTEQPVNDDSTGEDKIILADPPLPGQDVKTTGDDSAGKGSAGVENVDPDANDTETNDTETKTTENDNKGPTNENTVVAEQDPDPTENNPVQNGGGDDGQIQELLGPMQKARSAEKWKTLSKLSSAAAKKYPEEKQFANYKAIAQRESRAYPWYAEFQRALKANRYAQAASSFKKIPVNSVYYGRSRGSYDRMRVDYITIQTTKARNYAENGNCAAQKRLANNVPQQWPEARTSILRVQCVPLKNDPGSGNTTTKPPVDTTPPNGNPQPVNPTPPADFDKLVADSKSAATSSLFGKSYRLCKEALSIKPRDQEAIMICAIASCNLKNEKAAKNYVGKIQSATRKNNVVQICLRNGIEGL